MVFDPKNPKRVYAAGAEGILMSDEAGHSWTPANQGLDKTGFTALAIDPSQPTRLYAAASDGRLFRSDDSAANWRPVRP